MLLLKTLSSGGYVKLVSLKKLLKTLSILVNTILNIHKDWTILFKQQSKTIQQQLGKSKAFFFEDMVKIFWARKPNCKRELKDK